MTHSNDPTDARTAPKMDAEISKAMAEAEQAVESLRPDSADGLDLEIEDATPGRDAVEDALAERIAELEDELAKAKDRWLRAVADNENFKKRSKREMEDAVVRGSQKLLQAFLPTVDNLDRALEIAVPALEESSVENKANIQQVITGLTMVRDEFLGALKKQGIDPVESVGLAFDPAVHDALQQVDSPDHAPGTVVREFEKGYRMGDRLLRPARVIVAGSGSGANIGTSEAEA
jgi:molecular chaperone GrpE